MAPAPAFYLDKAKHEYHFEGRIIPGCTAVLQYWKLIDDRYYTERGRQIGTAVHAWSILVDRGTLEWSRVAKVPEIEGRLRGYAQFLKDYTPEWDHIEESFYYPGGLYACTIDRAGKLKGIDFGIVELKCGGKEAWHEIQTGMQQKAMDSRPWRRFALYLKEDGTYALEPHKDNQAGMIGVGLASAMNWRVNRAA